MKKSTVVLTVLFTLFSTAATLCAADAKVLARIGDVEITDGYLKKVIDEMPPRFKQQVATLDGRKDLLKKIVEMKVVAGEARRKGLEAAPGVMEKIEQILAIEYMGNLKKTIKIDEAEIKKFYDENKAQYLQKEQVQAKHILVKTEEEAKAVQEELKGGKAFGEIAAAQSVCPSKAKGGDLGWFERGRMVPEFEEAAFGLKKGETSGIVKTQFGYHIIQATDRKEPAQKEMAEVSDAIRQQLEQARMGDLFKSTVERLKAEQKVEIMSDKVE